LIAIKKRPIFRRQRDCKIQDDIDGNSLGNRGGVNHFDCGTKTERRATILLPNWVAKHDTKRDVMDGSVKILKENSTA
jgi:hypothetical protein